MYVIYILYVCTCMFIFILKLLEITVGKIFLLQRHSKRGGSGC